MMVNEQNDKAQKVFISFPQGKTITINTRIVRANSFFELKSNDMITVEGMRYIYSSGNHLHFEIDNNLFFVNNYLFGCKLTNESIKQVKKNKIQHILLDGNLDQKLVTKLSQIPFIKTVSVRNVKKQGFLVEIVKLKSILGLFIEDSLVTDEDLHLLNEFTSLYLLSLKSTGITDDGLIHLKRLTNLYWLDLSYTKINGAGFTYLKELISLCVLNCERTRFTGSELVHLEKLTNLSILDLSETETTDAGLVHLEKLTNLSELALQNAKITDAGLVHLEKLTNLSLLYIWGTKITDIGLVHLEKLTNLSYLDLSKTKTTDAGLVHLEKLTNLSELVLQNTKITDAGLVHLEKLTNLSKLAIAKTKITDAGLAHLEKLTNLSKLYIWGTKITDAGLVHLEKLTNLSTLDLSETETTDAGFVHLEKLTNLSKLAIIKTKITDAGLLHLEKLTNLSILNIAQTKITDARLAHLEKLTNLSQLYISSTKITDAGLVHLEKLTNLSILNIAQTKITDAGLLHLEKLTNLSQLYIFITKITDAGLVHLEKLTNLTILDLRYNKIKHLPKNIVKLPKLKELKVSGNPLETPPLEVANKGLDEIRSYFEQLEREGTDYLYEAKLILIGEPGVGKTSLAKKIENPNFELQPQEDYTRGIDIIKWSFRMKNNTFFNVNIWDFGGHQIYHATHQFFLTKRSLYTLVDDTREEKTDFFYWLHVTELLSDCSPLLIIQNEKQNRSSDLCGYTDEITNWRGEFSNLKEILQTNLQNNRGLDNILKKIKHYITELPHVGTKLPKTWTRIRQILINDDRNYIDLNEYISICESNGFKERNEQLELSGYLHDLGNFLHFQDNPVLKNIIILKPTWGTDAVYKVFDDEHVIKNFGRFNNGDLRKIWGTPQYNNMHDELLELMIKFKLCYKIPNSGKYIAPQLLKAKEIPHTWNTKNNLHIQYEYEFMPKGIISQFIVMMHTYIHEQQYMWKHGVILFKNDTKAKIVEHYYQRKITVHIAGENQKDLLTIIMFKLEEIHRAYQRLKYEIKVPCNCHLCKESPTPHLFPLEVLRKCAASGKNISCYKSFEMVAPHILTQEIQVHSNKAKHSHSGFKNDDEYRLRQEQFDSQEPTKPKFGPQKVAKLAQDCVENYLTKDKANLALMMTGTNSENIDSSEDLQVYFTNIIKHVYSTGVLKNWLIALSAAKFQFVEDWLTEL
ncbi:COR domain-containing protein [Candidatus Uabimicrobium sp. HlEnr_7]|uniref:COR domain-containing protein n=1 Tax=Candidatus Uabimicrobium helgolandensis TaxID=3095367 RepID=UPI003557A00D